DLANNTEPAISLRTVEGSGTEENVSVIVREPVKGPVPYDEGLDDGKEIVSLRIGWAGISA
ncbi:MAG TPA: hypothetical protein VJV04_16105, partial [Nitrospiraceae bacterium]|nr:hypothetical protein [Nitrospiraceae bacterium]